MIENHVFCDHLFFDSITMELPIFQPIIRQWTRSSFSSAFNLMYLIEKYLCKIKIIQSHIGMPQRAAKIKWKIKRKNKIDRSSDLRQKYIYNNPVNRYYFTVNDIWIFFSCIDIVRRKKVLKRIERRRKKLDALRVKSWNDAYQSA